MGSRFLPPLAAFLFVAMSLSLALSLTTQAQASPPLYLALGDSLAFGVGADSPQDEGYVSLTADALRGERFKESGLDLVNLGVPGATSGDLLQPEGELERALAEIEGRAGDGTEGNEVALISISIGGNDLLALAEPNAPCIRNAGSEACRTALTLALSGLQANLTQLLRQLRQAAPDAAIYVVNLYNPYSGSGDDFEVIASVGVQQFNGVIGVAALNESFRAHLVPVFEHFQGRSRQWIAQDGIHPNNKGYRAIAEALQASIEGRPVSIPEDLLALPTEAPVIGSVRETGIKPVVLYTTLPVMFLAGAALSAAYFVMRGRA